MSIGERVPRRWARPRSPHAGDPLFVYGTLRFPEVLNELIGRTPELEPAQLPGRRAAALPGRVYPGLVIATGAVAQGFLLHGLTSAEWEILDAFEDDEYDLQPVCVHAGERELYAWTYTWLDPVALEQWSPERFAIENLPDYLGRTRAWRRGLFLPSGAV
ncbi:gamma-glutamylcyclotransferase family protein [Nocardia jejuensis]|uniref:gamma-glutamylcyclotransferase family protein n=1 Tax=Nocardia jejuensis TaxID=328049 RepID=UPI000AEA4DC5|nr:gamma-glutamylcyclotransferase family protein [Nocardia jejuensis]